MYEDLNYSHKDGKWVKKVAALERALNRFDPGDLRAALIELAQRNLDLHGALFGTVHELADESVFVPDSPRHEMYGFPPHNRRVAAEILERVCKGGISEPRLYSPTYTEFVTEIKDPKVDQLIAYSAYFKALFEDPDPDRIVEKEGVIISNCIAVPDLIDFAQTTPGMGGVGLLLPRIENGVVIGDTVNLSGNNILYQQFIEWMRGQFIEYIASRTVDAGDPYGVDMPANQGIYEEMLDVPTTMVIGPMGSGKTTYVQSLLNYISTLRMRSNTQSSGSAFLENISLPSEFMDIVTERALLGMNLGRVGQAKRPVRIFSMFKPWGLITVINARSPQTLRETMEGFQRVGKFSETDHVITEQPALWGVENHPKAVRHMAVKWNLNPGLLINSQTVSLIANHRNQLTGVFMSPNGHDVISPMSRNTQGPHELQQTFYNEYKRLPQASRLMLFMSAVFRLPITSLDNARVLDDLMQIPSGKYDPRERFLGKGDRRIMRHLISMAVTGMFDCCVCRPKPQWQGENNFTRDMKLFQDYLESYGCSNIGTFVSRLNGVDRRRLLPFVYSVKSLDYAMLSRSNHYQ